MEKEGASTPNGLLQYVKRLEHLDSGRRGTEVEAALRGMGIVPRFERLAFPRVKNIIVDYPAVSSQERLLFSAHYDVVKGCPGANDNASGVAVLLGLCQHLHSAGRGVPLRLVFFDREEAWLRTPFLRLGLLGSFGHVLRHRLHGIRAVYNLEYAGAGDRLALWPLKGRQNNLQAVVRARAAAAKMGLGTSSAHIPWLFLSSDHLPFRLRGLADALTLSLLPSSELPALEKMMAQISILKLLAGRRPTPPPIFARIHSAEDVSSHLSADSLQTMLKLLLAIIQEYEANW